MSQATEDYRVALIDLGTNSIRLDIHDIEANGRSALLHREKKMVRLGEEVFSTGKLQADAMTRCMKALKYFRETCDDHDVQKTRCLGTSALRTAKNSSSFCRKVKDEFGFDIKVISGKKEAALILRGLLSEGNLSEESFGFIDIGGGSTEIGICLDSKLSFLESFKVGAARLNQMFLEGKNPKRGIEKLRAYAKQEFQSFKPPKNRETQRTFGTSGTIKAVQKIVREKHDRTNISRRYVNELIEQMIGRSKKELLEIPGMEPKRVDLILSGTVLLDECMEYLDCKKVRFMNYALRDGMLFEERKRYLKSQ